jgi:tRNA modification GTPase
VNQPTIFALASGAGRAGVAVIRISGPAAASALASLSGLPMPPPRDAVLRRLTDPASGAPLDDALAIYFRSPNSFTGEDVVELHVHGGPAVIEGVSLALAAHPGMRVAEPGEFTRRAFENGKMDLTAAEAIADLVDAETDGQRRQALRQMHGALGALYEGWREKLISALALYEAEIDFPDEGLPEDLARRAAPLTEALDAEMTAHLSDGHRGERVREGFRIAIIGAPNAGKSSLLNALALREAAIVSDIPGTTRDVVEVRLVLSGYAVWLADTAGLRQARDVIEAEGVRRALARAEDSDLRIGVIDRRSDELSVEAFASLRPADIVVLSKADLKPGAAAGPALQIAEQRGVAVFEVSALTRAGIADLEGAITKRVVRALGREEAPALSRARHRQLVETARDAVRSAQAASDAELAAEDLRLAARAIGRITGRVDVELVLDAIFAEFCIGK